MRDPTVLFSLKKSSERNVQLERLIGSPPASVYIEYEGRPVFHGGLLHVRKLAETEDRVTWGFFEESA